MLIILYYNVDCRINTHIDSDIAIAARLYKTFDMQSIVVANLTQADPFSYLRVYYLVAIQTFTNGTYIIVS